MNTKSGILTLLFSMACASPVLATYHEMQIEQVIGGLNGDTGAQAIQLRMRAANQNHVRLAKIRAWDAAGGNPVVVLNLTSDVPEKLMGSRVLLATATFTHNVRAVNPKFTPDFLMARPIPPEYLNAGRLTFEENSGKILWSLAWGGPFYTGSHAGARVNDADKNFGPAFPLPLPTANRRALRFHGAAWDPSTSNSLDYELSANPARLRNNKGTLFTIGPVPEIVVEQPAGNHLRDNLNKVDFGSVKISEGTKAQTFTIRNTGTAPLTRLAVVKSGTKPSDYTVTQPALTTLGAGEKTTFTVTFDPAGRGLRQALIHIRSNDFNESPFDIEVSGKGTK